MLKKHIFISALFFLFVVVQATPIASDTGNLLKNLLILPKATATEITEDEIVCDNGDNVNYVNGVYSQIYFNPASQLPLYISCMSECQDVSSGPNHNYAIYIDVCYDDNSYEYGIMAKWETGTHDWEQASVVHIPKKPVKALYFHLLFRWQCGFAAFKNALVRPATSKDIQIWSRSNKTDSNR